MIVARRASHVMSAVALALLVTGCGVRADGTVANEAIVDTLGWVRVPGA